MSVEQLTFLERGGAVAPPPQVGLYGTVMADPPWLESGAGQIRRGADRHYPLMKTRDICALPVGQWAARDAHLYLWVTNNFLPDGLDVMRAWGFSYKTKIDWFKGDLFDVTADDMELEVLTILGDHVGTHVTPVLAQQLAHRIADHLRRLGSPEPADDARLQVGIGQYFRGVTESCLFGVRGSLPYRTMPDGKRAQGRTGFHAPRGAHSAKPETLRQMAERVSHGPYLELFARRSAPGWDVWGHEAPKET